MYSELSACPNIQMWLNNEVTTTARSKTKYSIYVYNEPRTLPNVQVWVSNVTTRIKFFDNRCVIFLQLSKYTNVVLKRYHHY